MICKNSSLYTWQLSPFEGGRGMRMERNYQYNNKLKTFARNHRNESTRAEIRIWCEILRNRKMMGLQFLRQRPIGPYIADFFCKDLLLVIEIDGYTHQLEEIYLKDIAKTNYLVTLGIHVLRFSDNEVMNEIEYVRRTLELWIENHPPTPFKGGQ
jgi:very-short-patch-repair endonuclease